MIVLSLIINTIIAWKVLPQMRKNLGCSTVTVEAIFILVLFEIIMLFRIYIVGY